MGMYNTDTDGLLRMIIKVLELLVEIECKKLEEDQQVYFIQSLRKIIAG